MTSSRSAQNHRITAWLKLEEMSGRHQVKPHCSSRTTQRQLPRTMLRWLLIITKDGDPTTSLCNLCQGWVTLAAVLGRSFWRRKYWPCGQRTTSASKTPGTTRVAMDILWWMGHIPSVRWKLWICWGQTDHQIPLSMEMSETFILYCKSTAVTVQNS